MTILRNGSDHDEHSRTLSSPPSPSPSDPPEPDVSEPHWGRLVRQADRIALILDQIAAAEAGDWDLVGTLHVALDAAEEQLEEDLDAADLAGFFLTGRDGRR